MNTIRFCTLAFIGAALNLCAACKSSPKGSNESKLRSSDAVELEPRSWDELFQDEPADEETRLAISECLKAFGITKLKFASWPSDLKRLLKAEAEELPVGTDISRGIRGLFLVVGMKDFSGLACGAKVGQRQPVVFDEGVFVTKRKAIGDLGKELAYPMKKTGKSGMMVGTKGDFALDTFVHELMHVYASQKQQVFKDLTALSWKSAGTDKFGISAKLGLTESAPAVAPGGDEWAYDPVACRRRGDDEGDAQNGLGLGSGDDARDEALKRDTDDGKLHKKLIDSTNFIDQYASTNAHEDFAETAALYWRGTVKNDWPEYEYRERTKEGRPGKVIFSYVPKDVVATSKLHHEKICKFAEKIFKADCAELKEKKEAKVEVKKDDEKKAEDKDEKKSESKTKTKSKSKD